MQLPNREQLESNLAKRLGSLGTRQRRRLRELMGFPPDPSKVPESFWAEVEEESRQETLAALYLLFLSSERFHFRDAGADLSNRFEAKATEFAERQSAELARRWSDRMRRRFDAVQRRLDARRPAPGPDVAPDAPPKITRRDWEDELTDVVDAEDAASEAATEATRAQTAGGDAAAEETFGLSPDDAWINQPHLTRTGPCERCEALHNKPRSEWAAIDSYAANGPPLHDYCILPGQTATPLGELVGAAQSLFDGPCVEIALADGARIAVTENHPILTPRGWVAAKLIRKGDDVIGSVDAKRIAAAAGPQNDHGPAFIEQIFRSLEVVPAMVSRSVPLPPVAFHGDARFIDGNVDVVAIDRELLRHAESSLAKHGRQAAFHFGRAAQRLLSRCRSVGDFARLRSAALAGGMGRGDLLGPLGGAHILPDDGRRLAAASRANAGVDDPLPKRRASDAQLGGQGLLGFAGNVSGERRVDPWDRPAEHANDASPSHAGVERGRFDAKLAAKFAHRFARQIARREVVQVRRFNYAGHVYDLQSPRYRLYDVNGVIVSNCACIVQYAAAEVRA